MNDLSIYRDGRNSPARKLRKGKFGTHIVHFPSLKNNKTVVCESELEADLCLLFEYEPSVLEYRPQADTYRFTVNEKTRTYTPDFMATYDTGEQIYFEVKPDNIEGNGEYMEMSNTFSEKIKTAGYGFELLMERHIRIQPRMENLKELYSRISGITECEQAHLMDTLALLSRAISIHDLINMESPPSFRAVAHAIFFQKIEFNIDSPMGPHSCIAPVTFNGNK